MKKKNGLIVTLTVNPAIDNNVVTERLAFDDRTYILSTWHSAGGRGINASTVLHSFGAKTMTIAPSGGKSGKLLERLVSGSGFPTRFVRIHEDIRTNLMITDKQGLAVKLDEKGPAMKKEELERLEEAVRESLSEASWLLICGSLPPDVQPALYARLVSLARTVKVRTLLDTDGKALLEGIEAKPTVVKPNQQEAERLLDTVLITRTHFLKAAERIQAMGAESVILSLGSRGAVGAYEDRIVEVTPPIVDAVSPIGAGDALAAAFAWAMCEKKTFPDAVRWGVAAGSASACLPGVSFASLEQTKEMYERVEVRQFSQKSLG